LQDGIFVSDLVVDKRVAIVDDADMPVVAVVPLQEEVESTGPVDASGAATAAAIEAEKASKASAEK
jgi:hypothetical protein